MSGSTMAGGDRQMAPTPPETAPPATATAKSPPASDTKNACAPALVFVTPEQDAIWWTLLHLWFWMDVPECECGHA